MDNHEEETNTLSACPPLTDVLCADDDHDWEYKQDTIGDFGVVNGTYVDRWLECCICGATKPATYEDAPTYDDVY